MKQTFYTPKVNFHNQPPLKITVCKDNTTTDLDTGKPAYLVNARAAKRINKHFCGMSGCTCPGGELRQIDSAGTMFRALAENCE